MPLAVEFLRRFGPDMQMTTLVYQIYMVPWNIADINHDGYIDPYGIGGKPNELREAVRHIYGSTPIYQSSRTYNPSWTLAVAPGVKDMHTDQVSVNLEREVVRDFSISATYIYKHAADLFVNVPINRNTGQEWEYERVPFKTSEGQTVQLYSIKWKDYNGDGVIDGSDVAWVGDNTTFRVENMQTYDGKKPQRTYQGLQLVLNKRYAKRWQALGSVVYSWSNGTAQRTMRQSDNMIGPMVTDDTWMGSLNYTINNMDGPLPYVPKWEVKASGSYTIPYIDLDFGLRFRFHTGRPIWKLENYAVHSQYGYPAGSVISGGLNRIVAVTTPTYMPNFAIFDVRLEKAVQLGKYGAVHVVMDILNALNRSNVTDCEYIGYFGRITGIMDARRFRLSLQYQF
jgi:hypothetical protein